MALEFCLFLDHARSRNETASINGNRRTRCPSSSMAGPENANSGHILRLTLRAESKGSVDAIQEALVHITNLAAQGDTGNHGVITRVHFELIAHLRWHQSRGEIVDCDAGMAQGGCQMTTQMMHSSWRGVRTRCEKRRDEKFVQQPLDASYEKVGYG